MFPLKSRKWKQTDSCNWRVRDDQGAFLTLVIGAAEPPGPAGDRGVSRHRACVASRRFVPVRRARFFLRLIERSLTRSDEGLYRWLGEQHAQAGTGASVRPDGYGRYLLPDGEITFYLEVDRATEPARRVKAKLDAYRQALAADPQRDRGNVLLVCESRRRLANLARCAPPGPPWVWGSSNGEVYELLPAREQQRDFLELPAGPHNQDHQLGDCLGRRWRQLGPAEPIRARAAT